MGVPRTSRRASIGPFARQALLHRLAVDVERLDLGGQERGSRVKDVDVDDRARRFRHVGRSEDAARLAQQEVCRLRAEPIAFEVATCVSSTALTATIQISTADFTHGLVDLALSVGFLGVVHGTDPLANLLGEEAQAKAWRQHAF
jgi:hypothetical protein